MTMSKIGLKLANGEFYPVLDEGIAARKRLVVTTVQDGQRSVQIDIYRGNGPTIDGAEYAGSLVIDNIPFAPKGEPDIRVDLGLDEDGKLSAYAEELSSGEHQSLEVSLESLAEEEKYEIPDFAFGMETDKLPEEEESGGLLAAASSIREEEEPLVPSMEEGEEEFGIPASETSIPDFEEETAPPPLENMGLPDFDESPAPRGGYGYSGEEIVGSPVVEESAGRRNLAPIIAFVVIALALVLGAAWAVYHFFLQPKTGDMAIATPPAATAPVTPATTTPAPVPVQPAPVAEAAKPVAPAPAAKPTPAPAAAQAAPAAPKAPTVSPPSNASKKPGVYYKLRWGDTLWDLAYTFYRNPWLFGKIAKANSIKNPDHIIAGRTIWVPPLK